MDNQLPDFQDGYPWKFDVLILENRGRLAEIHAIYNGQDPDLRSPAGAESAEQQLQDEEETYSAFPDDDPTVRFIDALDSVLSSGSGSPFAAKTIEAAYVMESRMGSTPRPVWAITLRGLPPFSAHGPNAYSVPVWQRNHMRNVLDAISGEILFATNSPQP